VYKEMAAIKKWLLENSFPSHDKPLLQAAFPHDGEELTPPKVPHLYLSLTIIAIDWSPTDLATSVPITVELLINTQLVTIRMLSAFLMPAEGTIIGA
jgi:hypothetical protein